ncbi:MAG: 2TM domain-containing protein [Bacteroidota bacterium]
MEVMEDKKLQKLNRAKKRVEELKGFYWHLSVYLAVNLFISISKIGRNIGNGESFSEAFFDFGTFVVWIFWGIGLVFHAVRVFSRSPFFGKGWEETQIRKYMERERREIKKYTVWNGKGKIEF